MPICPAEYVIKVFGGVRPLSRLLHREPSTISKWRKPVAKKGTGGKVPRKAAEKILIIAKRRGLDITPTDLILGR